MPPPYVRRCVANLRLLQCSKVFNAQVSESGRVAASGRHRSLNTAEDTQAHRLASTHVAPNEQCRSLAFGEAWVQPSYGLTELPLFQGHPVGCTSPEDFSCICSILTVNGSGSAEHVPPHVALNPCSSEDRHLFHLHVVSLIQASKPRCLQVPAADGSDDCGKLVLRYLSLHALVQHGNLPRSELAVQRSKGCRELRTVKAFRAFTVFPKGEQPIRRRLRWMLVAVQSDHSPWHRDGRGIIYGITPLTKMRGPQRPDLGRHLPDLLREFLHSPLNRQVNSTLELSPRKMS